MQRKPCTENFHLALRSWVRAKRITFRALALKSGLSTSAIDYYAAPPEKKQHTTPGLYALLRMADVLGVTLDELVTGANGEGLGNE